VKQFYVFANTDYAGAGLLRRYMSDFKCLSLYVCVCVSVRLVDKINDIL